MKKKSIIAAVAMLLAISAVAGCGTDKEKASGGQENQSVQSGTDAPEGEENPAGGSEEKTEVRREDYPDCDGSGHGYVEIYYSDGSMETEEY